MLSKHIHPLECKPAESCFGWHGGQVGLGRLDGSNLPPIVARLPVPPAALRSHAKPAITPCLPDGLLVVVNVGHSTDSDHAFLRDVDLALGGHSEDASVSNFADKLGGCAGCSGNDASFPSKDFYVVHHRPQGEGSHWMGVTLCRTYWKKTGKIRKENSDSACSLQMSSSLLLQFTRKNSL